MHGVVLLALCVVAALGAPASTNDHIYKPMTTSDMTFSLFKAKFNKAYNSPELEAQREAAFNWNVEFVARHNADLTQCVISFFFFLFFSFFFFFFFFFSFF
jgi:hypothetical protein